MRHFLAPAIRSYIGCEAACKFDRRQVNGPPNLFPTAQLELKNIA